jgi:thioredoxin 1
LADEVTDVDFVKIDVDVNEEAAAKCEIRCMPTFQFYKGGKKVDTMEGADIDALKSKVSQLK